MPPRKIVNARTYNNKEGGWVVETGDSKFEVTPETVSAGMRPILNVAPSSDPNAVVTRREFERYTDCCTGPQGFQGKQGGTGERGEHGAQGFQGWQGKKGCPGEEGPKGDDGCRGRRGRRGFQGFQGELGPQGCGAQGCCGPQCIGPQGPQGLEGFGFQGLLGPQGDFGFQGRTGCDGNDGCRGLRGYQGFQGFQGIGAQGDMGWQGDFGFQGDFGAQGFQGEQGFQGDVGDGGAQGNNGPQGFQGLVGPQAIEDDSGETDASITSGHNVVSIADLQLTWNTSPGGLLQLGINGTVDADPNPTSPFDQCTIVIPLPPPTLAFTPVWDTSQKSGAGSITMQGGLQPRNSGLLSGITVTGNVLTLTFSMVYDMINLDTTVAYNVATLLQFVPSV